MMWQAPVLSLTAQAFLLTIALGAESSITARLTASFLSAVAAFASVILMQKHRALEKLCSVALEAFERNKEREGYVVLHKQPDLRTHPFWVRWSSHVVWTVCLSLFGITSVLIFVVVAGQSACGSEALLK